MVELGNLGAKGCRMECFALTILLVFINTYDCDWQADLLRDQWKVVAVGGTNRTQAVEINGSFRLGGWHPGTTEWYGGACLSY